jgi:hypothetical protein
MLSKLINQNYWLISDVDKFRFSKIENKTMPRSF